MAERLFLQERLDQIATLVREQGRVSVAELSERFGVTPVTVRNDLTTLEQQGLLVRTHGGAMVDPTTGLEPAFALRQKLHAAEKERIGRAAAELVRDGDTIAFDASTTAWQVARHVKDRRELTVVTNGLYIALEFLHLPGVTVVMPGGTLRGASASLVGEIGADCLGRLDRRQPVRGCAEATHGRNFPRGDRRRRRQQVGPGGARLFCRFGSGGSSDRGHCCAC